MNENIINEIIKEYVESEHLENIKFIQEKYNQHCCFTMYNEDMYIEMKRYEKVLEKLEEK